MTRRIDLTDEQIVQLSRLARYLTTDQIADVFGFTDRTLRKKMHNDPRIRSAYKRGKARAIRSVARSLITMATKGKNVSAAIFYLKTQAGWRETEHIPASSEISKLSDRELQKRRGKIGLAG